MDYNRVKWAARRGMLELDLVLEPFVRLQYPNLSEDEQQQFQKLLTYEDQELFAWFLRNTPAEEAMQSIVDAVLDFKKQNRV